MASNTEPLQLKNDSLVVSREYSASENLFSCSVCQNILVCVSRKELTAHIKACKLKKAFSCSICKKVFDRKADMEYHVKVHSDEKHFTCHVCDRVFKRKMKKNSRMTLLTGEKLFAWRVTKHMMLHANQEPFCVICSKTFSTWNSLKPHFKIHSRRFPCSICPKRFTGENELALHMKLHKRYYRNSCGVCRKVFASRTGLNNHMIMHSGEKPFTCHICMKSCARKGNLNKHMRIHTGEQPFSCELCNMAFTWEVQLTKHLETHSREKCTCTCMKTFASDSQLRTHLKNCTGKNPFFCEFCQTMFLKAKDKNNHTVIRMGRKRFRYACCVCEMTFSRKCKMDSHIKTHPRKNKVTNVKCKPVKRECEKIVKIENGSEGENQSWSDFGNNTVSVVETTPWTCDETIACSVCGMDYLVLSQNWYIMDVGSGTSVTLCDKCQHVPMQCALCYNIIELMDLRSHLGMHTGEIAWMSYSS